MPCGKGIPPTDMEHPYVSYPPRSTVPVLRKVSHLLAYYSAHLKMFVRIAGSDFPTAKQRQIFQLIHVQKKKGSFRGTDTHVFPTSIL